MPSAGRTVIDRYADPARVYHDVQHLVEVLLHVDTLAGEGRDLSSVELAAWFHDAVYDVRRNDNEQASADLARSLLTSQLPAAQVDEIVRLVLLTRDHGVDVGDVDGAVLCDADLAILASDPAGYADYTTRVRREYAHLPGAVFRAGRAEVLRGLLALPSLFHTTYAAKHWETPARANLEAELSLLTL